MALVTLCSYRDPIDAELAKTRLDHAGIAAVLVDQFLPSIQWLYSFAIGGVKLKVDESDFEAAITALAEDRTADLEGIPESRGSSSDRDSCPECGSEHFRTSRVRRTSAALSLATSLPLIAWRRRWVCSSCGHSWTRTPVAAAPPSEETIRAEELVHEKRSYPMLPVLVATLLGLAVLCYVQYRIRHPS